MASVTQRRNCALQTVAKLSHPKKYKSTEKAIEFGFELTTNLSPVANFYTTRPPTMTSDFLIQADALYSKQAQRRQELRNNSGVKIMKMGLRAETSVREQQR